MNFCDKSDAPPSPFDGIEPNIVELFDSVVVNVEVANLRAEAGRRSCDVLERIRAIPRGDAR